MITLENFVLEQEISQCDVYDIFIEQALSEIDVACALLDTYAKNQAIMEYCAERNIDARVILEAADSDTETNDDSSDSKKKGKFNIGNAIDKAIDAIITCFKTLYAKLTRVPTKVLRKKLNNLTVKNVEANIRNGASRVQALRVNVNIAKDFENFCQEPFLEVQTFNYLIAADADKNPYKTDAFDNFLEKTKGAEDKYVSQNYKDSSVKDIKELTADEFDELFLQPLETYGVEKKFGEIIKLASKFTKISKKAGEIDAAKARAVAARLRRIASICTIYISEYSKLCNKIIGEASSDNNTSIKNQDKASKQKQDVEDNMKPDKKREDPAEEYKGGLFPSPKKEDENAD